MQKLRGTLRQKNAKGNFYYRLTVANGLRKEFALKTSDETEALQRAEELDSIWAAPTMDVAVAQINAIKGFSRQAQMLPLSEGWTKYEVHPERATPHTVSEQLAYKTTYEEFVAFVTAPEKHHTVITSVAELNSWIAEEYANFMKSKAQAVDTHNRKIKRLRKIFDCLKDYYSGENPFRAKTLLRNIREEQDTIVRRQAFSKEQEQQLREVLANDKYRVMNKSEIRVIYYVGMFTGQRLKDCVLLQWQNIDMDRRRIWVKQFKTGKEVTIPMAAELYTVLQEAQNWRVDQYVCPKSAVRYNKENRNGKNVGNNLINIDVLRVIRWIGLEPSVKVPGRNKKMTVYGFHSLRHAFASFCAEAGVPKAVLLSILGTDSEIADKYYTHVGDAAQQQAIDAVSGTMNGKSDRDKINEALAVLESNFDITFDLREKLIRILS
ncbi:MAG: tyrosine-type recombinase/integrase [Victivallales bacterium]